MRHLPLAKEWHLDTTIAYNDVLRFRFSSCFCFVWSLINGSHIVVTHCPKDDEMFARIAGSARRTQSPRSCFGIDKNATIMPLCAYEYNKNVQCSRMTQETLHVTRCVSIVARKACFHPFFILTLNVTQYQYNDSGHLYIECESARLFPVYIS
jgi:hypothetical protein